MGTLVCIGRDAHMNEKTVEQYQEEIKTTKERICDTIREIKDPNALNYIFKVIQCIKNWLSALFLS